MFVHNYGTEAVWVKGHVGKKEMGREEEKKKTAGRNPDEKERGTETMAIFSPGTFDSKSRYYLQ